MTVDSTASNSKSSSSSASGSHNTPATAQSSNQSASNNMQQQTSYQYNNLPSGTPTNVVKKNRSEVIRTIQEITKFDEFTINQAIEACQDSEGRYSMDQVLNILMDEKYSNEHGPPESSSSPSKSRYYRQYANDPTGSSSNTSRNNDDSANKYGLSRGNASNSGSKDRPGDYTGTNLDDDDDDDLEACSSPNINKGDSSSANLSESNLLRDDDKPSGIKNVGNTCWFSSIIQAFFHLPCFRRLILSFQIDPNDISRLDENSKNVVQFVSELRKLFALMLKSKRKSINPNPTLKCLRMCSKYDAELFNQEDVSEFATILVNLIEESFDILYKLQQQSQSNNNNNNNNNTSISINEDKLSSSINMNSGSNISTLGTGDNTNLDSINRRKNDSNTDNNNSKLLATANNQLNLRKNRRNPIVNLLNGDILINRKNSDEDVTTEVKEIFREVNIQMLNSRNLHAGLELEWGETSIDKLTSPTNTKQIQSTATSMNKSFYEQESWIVQLPSVLFICLNRYKFVKATQSSSKIQEPFEFYPHVYLDRYMHANRDLVKAKRLELKRLNDELNKLEDKLKSIKNYKSLGSSGENQSGSDYSNNYALDEILKLTLQFVNTDHVFYDIFNSQQTAESGQSPDKDQQLDTVKNCLNKWINQVETRINTLKSQINQIKNKIDTIFDEESLKKIKYNLHSVCIHEGNATSGHFWTYIWNNKQMKWYKFNDTEVCESTWDDLYENAVGGNGKKNDSNNNSDSNKSSDRTPSAYFLVYTKANDENLYLENNDLDSDLMKLISDDHEALQKQLNSLRLRRTLREMIDELKKSNQMLSNANISLTEQNNQTCVEHAKAFGDSTFDALSSSFSFIDKSLSTNSLVQGAHDALQNAVENELNKYTETSKDILLKLPENDLRINHILSYFNSNNLSRELKVLALYDLFRIQIFSENSIHLRVVQTLAHIKYNEYYLATAGLSISPGNNMNQSQMASVLKSYEKWQADYRDFRSIIAAFINAANFMESLRFEEAAPFFCVACEYNERITSNLAAKMKGMDHEFLLANRRRCLKLWNQLAIRKFTNKSSHGQPLNQPLNQQELVSLIETMISKFLPCFFRLSGSTTEDKAMIEEIRQDWLNVLDANLPEVQIFHDFMTKIFEDPVANHYHSLNVNKTNLTTRYKDTVQAIQKTIT